MHLRYSEIPRRVTLAPSEAVTLALAAADACDAHAAGDIPVPLPPAEGVQLHGDGCVSVAAARPARAGDDRARALALLVRTLLPLDAGGERPKVPGGLMVALARACGQIDLPAPSYEALRATLDTFGSGRQSRVLSDIYRRCTTHSYSAAGPRAAASAAAPAFDTPIASAAAPFRERRRAGATVSALRRELRVRDRELFEARARARPARRVAAGSAALLWLAAAAVGCLIAVGAEHARGWVPPRIAVSVGMSR